MDNMAKKYMLVRYGERKGIYTLDELSRKFQLPREEIVKFIRYKMLLRECKIIPLDTENRRSRIV